MLPCQGINLHFAVFYPSFAHARDHPNGRARYLCTVMKFGQTTYNPYLCTVLRKDMRRRVVLPLRSDKRTHILQEAGADESSVSGGKSPSSFSKTEKNLKAYA